MWCLSCKGMTVALICGPNRRMLLPQVKVGEAAQKKLDDYVQSGPRMVSTSLALQFLKLTHGTKPLAAGLEPSVFESTGSIKQDEERADIISKHLVANLMKEREAKKATSATVAQSSASALAAAVVSEALAKSSAASSAAAGNGAAVNGGRTHSDRKHDRDRSRSGSPGRKHSYHRRGDKRSSRHSKSRSHSRSRSRYVLLSRSHYCT